MPCNWPASCARVILLRSMSPPRKMKPSVICARAREDAIGRPQGGEISAESLLAAARYPLYGPCHLGPGPPPVAHRSRLSHPSPANRLSRIRPGGHRTHGTPARLEQELQEHVKSWRLNPVVEALQALRGVQFTVAVTMVAELGDLTRFEHPRQLMKYLGLIPSEYSTGERRRQGSMTKAGNTHARRALVEGAWAYRYPAKVSRHLQLRLETQPKVIQDISWKAQVRLCKRYRRLIARGKHANQVVVAIARELVGFMWAIAKQVPVTP